MRIQRAAPLNELLAKLIFLILPTAGIGFFLLQKANAAYIPLSNQALEQTVFFLAGMAGAAVLYTLRIRFLPTFAALIVACWLFYKGIDQVAFGEFDLPRLQMNFRIKAILFVLGWLIGWGFVRLRYWSVIVSFLVLAGCISVIARQNSDTVDKLLTAFVPVALYCAYIIFTTEQIYSFKDKSQKFWWFLSRRLFAFGLLATLLLGGVIWLMRGAIKETVANYGGSGKGGQNSMLKKNKDNTFDLKDYTKLQSSLGRSNELLFCAHIDNYFDGTDIPNPLYLTAFYYTKFDTLTETFERDSLIPKNDLFEPDPSAIPLFSTRQDLSVVENSMTEKLGREVEIQVYSKTLSPTTYLAPHTGWFVQPITVDRDFRDSFRFAFRAKSYVSELNSAYFVYNAKDPQIEEFQKARFEVLRKVTDFSGQDVAFMRYYTDMPQDEKFGKITNLAKQVTAKANTPVDKILAIRDWYLSKDAAGQPLFKYTDNPGVPDIPSASKLQYFLFENRQGYCAYFAGATLFMLRSLGIPSRIAVGFLTVNRSDKNPGWYWYYADQAHAWVQVFFPGYGWLDFDTTVGNDDAQESPKPDGTPPLQPPKAWLAAEGIVQSLDTTTKMMQMRVHSFVFHDQDFTLNPAQEINMDVHIATVRQDSVLVPLTTIRIGDSATAVSYAQAFKNMSPAAAGSPAENVVAKFPKPAPVDEIYLRHKTKAEKKPAPVKTNIDQPFSWKKSRSRRVTYTCSAYPSLITDALFHLALL